MAQERHTRRSRPSRQQHEAQSTRVEGRSAKAATRVGGKEACEAGAPRSQRGRALLALTIPLVLCACPSTRTGSDVRSTNSMATGLSGPEWSSLAQDLVLQLEASGILASYQGTPGERVCLAIGDLQNNSPLSDVGRQFKTSFMPTFKSMMTQGQGGVPVAFSSDMVGTADAGTAGLRVPEELRSSSSYDGEADQGEPPAAPALVVTFTVGGQREGQGREVVSSTTVSMSLSDLRTREVVLVLTMGGSKQFTRGFFGG